MTDDLKVYDEPEEIEPVEPDEPDDETPPVAEGERDASEFSTARLDDAPGDEGEEEDLDGEGGAEIEAQEEEG